MDRDQSAKSVESPPGGATGNRGIGIIAFATVLALLYMGRQVLIPLTLALILSLLMAPLVRRLRRLGLGQAPAVLLAVLGLALLAMAAAGLLGTQVLRMAASLPQYERTIAQKLGSLDEFTVGRLDALTTEASRLVESHAAGAGSASQPGNGGPAASPPLPVEVHQPRAAPLQIIARVLASIWLPLETTGIVLVVLVFVLLEQEELRDRFIRVAGGTNIQLTTLALNDAGERLSRFFVSQFAVNCGVGVAVGLGLAALGVPQAALWGALATLLRFVPYVGIWIAAMLATTLAIAVAPGWSLAFSTIGLFLAVELVAGQIVEPNLYGHATGLSPLSVVVAAIFWSALWGPIGLVLSTPLTLCLLVIGRHIRALSFLDLLLGGAEALTLPQRLYQRALSGDADEIVAVARSFLKHNTFAAYCDVVVMPALHLAFLDRQAGAISDDQQIRIREVLVAVVSTLGGEPRRLRRRPVSVLDTRDAGLILRQFREDATGHWQGPVDVPPGSILLCAGLSSRADTIAAELLVRALRDEGLDARHMSIEELNAGSRPPDGDPAAIAVVYLVSAFPSAEREQLGPTIGQLRQHLPTMRVVPVLLPGMSLQPAITAHDEDDPHALYSFVGAVQCATRVTAS
jgi:predicted PurR-regulated permease PerM